MKRAREEQPWQLNNGTLSFSQKILSIDALNACAGQIDANSNMTFVDFSDIVVGSKGSVHEVPHNFLPSSLRLISLRDSNLTLSTTNCVALRYLTNLEKLVLNQHIAASNVSMLFQSLALLQKLHYVDLRRVAFTSPETVQAMTQYIATVGKSSAQSGDFDLVISMANVVNDAEPWLKFGQAISETFHTLCIEPDTKNVYLLNYQPFNHVLHVVNMECNTGVVNTITWGSLSSVHIKALKGSEVCLALDHVLSTVEVYDQLVRDDQFFANLKTLSLIDCKFLSYDVPAIVGRIAQQTTITSLSISGSDLPIDQHFSSFAKLTNLTTLSLGQNSIEYNAATCNVLIPTLQALTNLRTLVLMDNPIVQSEEGINAVVKVLTSPPCGISLLI